jgi:hypothetical protein
LGQPGVEAKFISPGGWSLQGTAGSGYSHIGWVRVVQAVDTCATSEHKVNDSSCCYDQARCSHPRITTVLWGTNTP